MDNLLRDRKSDFSDIFLTGNASQDYFKYGKSTKKVPFYISGYVVADLADLWTCVPRVLSRFQLTNRTKRTILKFPLLWFYLGTSFPLNNIMLFQNEIKRRAINMNTTSNDRILQRNCFSQFFFHVTSNYHVSCNDALSSDTVTQQRF